MTLLEQTVEASIPSSQATRLVKAIEQFIRGKTPVIELAVVCMLAEGHLLLDDVPGTGKTSLARALAAALGVPWQRIQFTPDVLPSDVTGVSVFHQGTSTFEFHPGPVFSSVVLADEINRASPRTQSALLEAMEERTVSVDGSTHALPSPFMVIATQNPVESTGTYPLPEAQLDRFLMRTTIGYPSWDSEVDIVLAHHAGARVSDVDAVLTPVDLDGLISAARSVAVDRAVASYMVALSSASRSAPGVVLGVSPRGTIALLRAARALALLRGRAFVTPGDVQELAEPVLAHRLVLDADAEARGGSASALIAQLIDTVPAPQPS